MTNIVCAVDIGGTFTDCVLIDEDGEVATAKSLSTHGEGAAKGFFNSIDAAAAKFGYQDGDVYDDLVRIAHGTTVATNTVVEEGGATTGLLTTRGFEDTATIMRGVGRATGEPPENVFKIAEIDKPQPIVPRELTIGIPERIDKHGNVVVPLDEETTRAAVRELADAGVEAIAITLLWSFYNPTHEERVKAIVEEEAPDVYVSVSHEISPSLGEYERTVATAINAKVGPVTASYIGSTERSLQEEYDFHEPFLMMQANGGNTPASLAAETPLTLIGSGPVGGLSGCRRLIEERNEPNIIATDMGGTSFEFGLIQDGEPLVEDEPVIQKYQYSMPKLDIKSIGAGGGSIAWLDEDSHGLRVGPESAGADPGPACYDRGGTEPTVTDANLILGYIDPEVQFGENMTPRMDLARDAVGSLGEQLDLTVEETAKGIFDIINAKMANLMENEVIGRGFDPRDFTVVSYGGAGPLHAASYADKLGIDTVIVPGAVSPVWSAYGISQSDLRHQLERQVAMPEPFDVGELQSLYDELEAEGRELLEAADVPEDKMRFNRVATMQFQGQLHDLEISVPGGELTDDVMEDVVARFEEQYEQRYSATARLPAAELEIVTIRSEPQGVVEKFERAKTPLGDADPPESARKPSRDVFVGGDRGTIEVDVYDGTALQPGNELAGPSVIDMPDTGIVVQDAQRVSVNEYHDFELKL
ncbi:hydantoinase/oxoprolinase family protein [Halorubellus salinus]|uniref:hydantoinase/oxoprolinase family protein n=1 Tax=Halorubellus salinus TaxID=755309 RepID=UPI001D089CC6|nr:hydantoinase/oxoprolinase family protein [Halorubellus salinus]